MREIGKNICVVTVSLSGRTWEFIVNAQDPNMALSYFQSMLKEFQNKGEMCISVQPAMLREKRVEVMT